MLISFPSFSIAETNVCHDKVAHLTLIGYCLTPDKHINLVLSSSFNKLVFNSDPTHPIIKKFFSSKIEKKYNSCAYTTTIIHKKIKNNTAFLYNMVAMQHP